MIKRYDDLKEIDLQNLPDGDPGRGYEIFDNNCSGCHEKDDTSSSDPQGPSLRGFIGRQAGSADNTFQYSEAMKRSKIMWNKLNLFIFLYAPVKMIPGTQMKIWGLQNAQDRADLISYLYSREQYVSPMTRNQIQLDNELQQYKKKLTKKNKRKQSKEDVDLSSIRYTRNLEDDDDDNDQY